MYLIDDRIICPLPFSTYKNPVLAANPFFDFEKDFTEDGIRCIPMIVRFKLDAGGIKLQLKEWNRLNAADRQQLSTMPCSTASEIAAYRDYLQQLVVHYCGYKPAALLVNDTTAWADAGCLPAILLARLAEFDWHISLSQWSGLAPLQRFVLLKLCRPGHENRNFPLAIKEFGLLHPVHSPEML
jgi:hypothetical protein